ncbi:MAG: hypothetical protein ABF380_11525, partial [Akkermansiaceae bacterium]
KGQGQIPWAAWKDRNFRGGKPLLCGLPGGIGSRRGGFDFTEIFSANGYDRWDILCLALSSEGVLKC